MILDMQKAPASKAPAKPKAAPKPKKASKKDAAVESIDEASPDVSDPVESDNSMEDSDEDAPVKKTAKASGSSGPKKSASEMYQKVSPPIPAENMIPSVLIVSRIRMGSCLNSSTS
jgi:hypothetical protein